MSVQKPAIIFCNNDLVAQVQGVLCIQLHLSEIISITEFDARVSVDPNYPHNVHRQGLRILVLLPSLRHHRHRKHADIVIFIKAGLASIESCKFGPPGHTLPVAYLTVDKLLAHFPETSFYCREDNCIQSNILAPLFPDARKPALFPFGSDKSAQQDTIFWNPYYQHFHPKGALLPVHQDLEAFEKHHCEPDGFFDIITFTGGQVVESGATVINPMFTMSYTSLPISAQLTNSDDIDSPLILTSPFQNATVTGSFTHNQLNFCVTFILTAHADRSDTKFTAIQYQGRSFAGIGTAGATSAILSGNNVSLIGATGILYDQGLHENNINITFGTFSPNNQKLYCFLPQASMTYLFIDQNKAPIIMKPPTSFTFINIQGAAITMNLYESVDVYYTPYTITPVYHYEDRDDCDDK